MSGFAVERRTSLDAESVWAALTDWARHGDSIPFTTVTRDPDSPVGVGERFIARTSLGPLHFDDPMQVTRWEPPTAAAPGWCRIEKHGRVVVGWAELTVTPGPSGGSTARWYEEARLRRTGGLLAGPTNLLGRRLFGRLVDNLLAGDPGDPDQRLG